MRRARMGIPNTAWWWWGLVGLIGGGTLAEDARAMAKQDMPTTRAATDPNVVGAVHCHAGECTFSLPLDPEKEGVNHGVVEYVTEYCAEEDDQCWEIGVRLHYAASEDATVTATTTSSDREKNGVEEFYAANGRGMPNDDDDDTNLSRPIVEAKTTTAIQIGDYIYQPPFDGFGADVQALLAEPKQQSSHSSLEEEAQWLQAVGLALHNRAYWLKERGDQAVTIEEVARRAVAILEEAIARYQEILNVNSLPSWELQRAMSYFQLAESYQLAASTQDMARGTFEVAGLALEQLYHRYVATGKSADIPFVVEVTLAWAQVCLRLGDVLLHSAKNEAGGGVAAAAEEWLILQAGDDWEQLLQDPDKMQQMLATHVQPVVEEIHRALQLFLWAKSLWWAILKDSRHQYPLPPAESLLHLRYHTKAVQNLGNTWLVLEQYQPAMDALEESWNLSQNTILPLLTTPAERENLIVALGENLYFYATIYMRMGDYETALQRYQSAMDLFANYRIAPPAEYDLPFDADRLSMIQEYEEALEEYHAMFVEGMESSDPGIYMNADAGMGEEEYYERDDGHEGDLHITLGGLYLDNGDYEQAATHLSQALHLYRKAGEGQDATAASTYLELADMYFQRGEYAQSADQYHEAVQIFRELLPPGARPLQHGRDDVIDWPGLFSNELSKLPVLEESLPPPIAPEDNDEQDQEDSMNLENNLESAAKKDSTDSSTKQKSSDLATPLRAFHLDLAALEASQKNETEASRSDEL